jgi:hypothetical protein
MCASPATADGGFPAAIDQAYELLPHVSPTAARVAVTPAWGSQTRSILSTTGTKTQLAYSAFGSLVNASFVPSGMITLSG